MHWLSIIAYRFDIHKHLAVKFIIDLILWVLAAPLAFFLRLDTVSIGHVQGIIIYTAIGFLLKIALAFVFALSRQSWHKIGVKDLYALLQAIGLLTSVLFAFTLAVGPSLSIPRSIPLIEGGLALFALSGARMSFRLLLEHEMAGRASEETRRRILIVGAGESGTMLVREMLRHPETGLEPVGYLDDESSKRRKTFVGVPVLGTIDELPLVVGRNQIDEVLIAIPSAPGAIIRHIVDLAREAQVSHRIIPGVYDILSGKVSINQIREVNLDDLLRRDPVKLDLKKIANYLEGRTLLVTGAGGSIGSEIVRQVVRFKPKQVLLLDRDENNLYLLERELDWVSNQSDIELRPIVADVQRYNKLERIFEHYRPQVIFHAAAHKHVPLMELSPDEAIINNVKSTRNLIELAVKYRIARFVNISTDKAIKPTSIMGASKRVSEYIVAQAGSRANGGQTFVSVRFGNVLGSHGSVIPIFKEQIRRGGPVTVTHSEMTRYFMSIPEAVQLVLQTAGIDGNEHTYILDMGEPVKIIDLARDLIRLSGLEPDIDIPIEITSPRPGEKLFEELFLDAKHVTLSASEGVFVVHANEPPDNFETLLADLIGAAYACDEERIRNILGELIPDYQPAILNHPQGIVGV